MRLPEAYEKMLGSGGKLGLWRPGALYLICVDVEFDPDGLSFVWMKGTAPDLKPGDDDHRIAGVGAGIEIFSRADMGSDAWVLLDLTDPAAVSKFELVRW